jgi:uncharacterized membrane protein
MDIFNIFSAFGLSASAGLNAYIPLLVVALLARYTKLITLKAPWDSMTSWWVIGVLIFLCVIEIIADKVPAVNHINDVIQTFVRPTAGAIVFAASASNLANVNPVLGLIAGLFIAGGVHAVKSLAIRPAVTAVTGSLGNVPVSIAEDATSTVVSLLAVALPVIAACVMVLVITILLARVIFKNQDA